MLLEWCYLLLDCFEMCEMRCMKRNISVPASVYPFLLDRKQSLSSMIPPLGARQEGRVESLSSSRIRGIEHEAVAD